MRLAIGVLIAFGLVALSGCVPTWTPASFQVVAGERIGDLVWIGMPESELVARGFVQRQGLTNPLVRQYLRSTAQGRVSAIVLADGACVVSAGISGALTGYRTLEGFGIRSRAPDLIDYYTNSPDWRIEVVNHSTRRSVTVYSADQPVRGYHFELSLPRDTNEVISVSVGINPAACPPPAP